MATKKTTTGKSKKKKTTRKVSKSISLGNGFKLNLSKSGINLSGGVKGARLSIGTGGVKSTLSVPGTDIRSRKTLVSSKKIRDTVKNPLKDSKNKPATPKSDERQNNAIAQSAIAQNAIAQSAIAQSAIAQSAVAQNAFLLSKEKGLLPLIIGNKAKRSYNVGVDFYAAKKYTQAVSEIEKSVRYDSENPKFPYAIGLIKVEFLFEYEAAKAYLLKAKELGIGDEADYLLAKCYVEEEKFALAHEMLSKIVLPGKLDIKRQILLARCVFEDYAWSNAIKSLTTIVENHPEMDDDGMEANYYLGVAYLEQFDYDLADIYLLKVQAVNENYKSVQQLMEKISLNK